jgi:hypothetical protein
MCSTGESAQEDEITMKLPNYSLVRIALVAVAAFFLSAAMYLALTLDRNNDYCITVLSGSAATCLSRYNSQIESIWIALSLSVLPIIGTITAPRIYRLIRSYLLNRTAALLFTTALFLCCAIANAGEPRRSMLVLTFGILSAIAFAGLVFGRRMPAVKE